VPFVPVLTQETLPSPTMTGWITPTLTPSLGLPLHRDKFLGRYIRRLLYCSDAVAE
jgi:hypothetical protein